jgi:hypothetical protein
MQHKRLALLLRKVYKKYGDLMSFYLSYYYSRWCRDIIKRNGLDIARKKGEEQYIQKWKQLSKNVNPNYYRIFSNYIKPSPNIVPEDICHNIIEHIFNPAKHRPYYADKNMFDQILHKSFLPTTLLRNINNAYLDKDYNYIKLTNDKDLDYYIRGNNSIIIKPTVNSSSGRNIDLFTKQEDGQYKHITNEAFLSIKYLTEKYSQNFIIQEKLEQHDYLANFNGTSINTLRFLTYKSVKTNKAAVTSAILRIGGSGAFIDNAHAGGVFVGVDSDGNLGKYACDQFGKKYNDFNGNNFDKNFFKIPHYEAAVDFAQKVANKVIHHRILALDIVITKDGSPKLLEYNIDSLSTWLFQFTISSAFQDYTDEIIEYCSMHKHEIEKVRVSVW